MKMVACAPFAEKQSFAPDLCSLAATTSFVTHVLMLPPNSCFLMDVLFAVLPWVDLASLSTSRKHSQRASCRRSVSSGTGKLRQLLFQNEPCEPFLVPSARPTITCYFRVEVESLERLPPQQHTFAPNFICNANTFRKWIL